ncbi:hypothetical protein DY000_02021337 [Brassica cretica]|uniref:Uncharacterized protein n=1 Tax=Brassica cretica TaxID=69181 RepID=A0ABQ7EHY5_BRACR|nr:hypothetical protein DY000_02021337 [Brassica cretica]
MFNQSLWVMIGLWTMITVWTDDDEVDGEETCQGNCWIYDDKCLRDDDEVDESLAPSEEMGQGTNSETITSLLGEGTT